MDYGWSGTMAAVKAASRGMGRSTTHTALRMADVKTMLITLGLALCWLLAGGALPAADTTAVVVEDSSDLQGPNGVGTRAYAPTPTELTYTQRITEKAINLAFGTMPVMPKPDNVTEAQWHQRQVQEAAAEAQKIPAKTYALTDQGGVYVGWCGILRSECYSPQSNTTNWTIQHTYFDGLCDLRMQVVSFFGAGDFFVVIPGDHSHVPRLSLIRAYGLVQIATQGGVKKPLVRADYVRTWDWGRFVFMDYGFDRTNPVWKPRPAAAACDIYRFRPDQAYYEARLGHRP